MPWPLQHIGRLLDIYADGKAQLRQECISFRFQLWAEPVCAAVCSGFGFQTLVTDQHEEMVDAKEDGTPMPLAHYNVGDGSHIILRIHVSNAHARPPGSIVVSART